MATLLPEDRARFHRDRRTNKTGFIGVTWKAREGMFVARIRVPGKKEKVWCGSSKTAKGAAIKYDIKARELFGVDAVVNFPEPALTETRE